MMMGTGVSTKRFHLLKIVLGNSSANLLVSYSIPSQQIDPPVVSLLRVLVI